MSKTFVAGLDLGQTADFSALAILEIDDAGAEPTYTMKSLERFKLGTSYVAIVRQVAEWYTRPPLANSLLAVDQTGVGRAVVDLMLAHPAALWDLIPITITAGHQVTANPDGSRHVPKKDLVGALQVLMQSGRLTFSRKLKEVATLVKELENFKVKITTAANETFGAWREGQHDDLVLAAALAAWIGETMCGGPFDTTPDPRNRSMFSQAPPGVWHGDFGDYSEHEWDDNDPRREDD